MFSSYFREAHKKLSEYLKTDEVTKNVDAAVLEEIDAALTGKPHQATWYNSEMPGLDVAPYVMGID